MYTHVCHTHLYNWNAMLCYLCAAVINDCKSEVMAYTVHTHKHFVDKINFKRPVAPGLNCYNYKTVDLTTIIHVEWKIYLYGKYYNKYTQNNKLHNNQDSR